MELQENPPAPGAEQILGLIIPGWSENKSEKLLTRLSQTFKSSLWEASLEQIQQLCVYIALSAIILGAWLYFLSVGLVVFNQNEVWFLFFVLFYLNCQNSGNSEWLQIWLIPCRDLETVGVHIFELFMTFHLLLRLSVFSHWSWVSRRFFWIHLSLVGAGSSSPTEILWMNFVINPDT